MSGVQNHSGQWWEKSDLFFLNDALARGMSIAEVAGFLNRSEEEVRERANLNRQSYEQSDFSSAPRAKESQRRSTAKKSTFSAGSRVSSANR
jgi:hypothetical protein